MRDFADVSTWVFDLDHTLYPPSAALFALIEARMVDWIAVELDVDRDHADRLRHAYWRRYGTTLAGLMAEHGTDPHAFQHAVHDVTLDTLMPDPVLAAALAALPGRRIVFTNGSEPYARRVLERCGIAGLFDAVYGVEHARFTPKPNRAAFEAIVEEDRIDPAAAAMFEDSPDNLRVPHEMGMRTVLVAPARAHAPPVPHIHHATENLGDFLSQAVNRAGPRAPVGLPQRA
ncbi:pyrimidine 5'-nucleotidase [Palleronia sediminis]|uniref:Pyrimidine 5'-nucleotidase n=1 Tax=Palleronia sediminis TaxID=2547833 RepID=A0A4V3B9N0_9RHOB|nr:pyrimidine 5'-nucleotidase [Palleronia sediminis]TDL79889.1 pyrimidine 5'-nucleotidase [Palleronia sediminis]